MGLFKSKEERAEKARERAAKIQERETALTDKNTNKVLDKANKYGVSTEGAEAAMYNFKDGSHYFLMVYPNRVEYKVLSLMMKTVTESQSIPMDKITSVTVDRQGFVTNVLTIHTSGTFIQFLDEWDLAPTVQATIQRLQ